MRVPVFVSVAMIATAAAAAKPAAIESATDGGRLVDAVSDCRKIADSAKRLDCYDSTVDKLASAKSGGDLVVLDRTTVQKTKRSLFGFEIPKLPFFDEAKRPGHEKTEEITEISAKIQRIRQAGYGIWTLYLDEGGTWQTTEAPETPPEEGDAIHIKRGLMGGYMANIRNARGVRIRRIG